MWHITSACGPCSAPTHYGCLVDSQLEADWHLEVVGHLLCWTCRCPLLHLDFLRLTMIGLWCAGGLNVASQSCDAYNVMYTIYCSAQCCSSINSSCVCVKIFAHSSICISCVQTLLSWWTCNCCNNYIIFQSTTPFLSDWYFFVQRHKTAGWTNNVNHLDCSSKWCELIWCQVQYKRNGTAVWRNEVVMHCWHTSCNFCLIVWVVSWYCA